jgi:hypothetical protein
MMLFIHVIVEKAPDPTDNSRLRDIESDRELIILTCDSWHLLQRE